MAQKSTKLYTAEQERKRKTMISWKDGIEDSMRDRVIKEDEWRNGDKCGMRHRP